MGDERKPQEKVEKQPEKERKRPVGIKEKAEQRRNETEEQKAQRKREHNRMALQTFLQKRHGRNDSANLDQQNEDMSSMLVPASVADTSGLMELTSRPSAQKNFQGYVALAKELRMTPMSYYEFFEQKEELDENASPRLQMSYKQRIEEGDQLYRFLWEKNKKASHHKQLWMLPPPNPADVTEFKNRTDRRKNPLRKKQERWSYRQDSINKTREELGLPRDTQVNPYNGKELDDLVEKGADRDTNDYWQNPQAPVHPRLLVEDTDDLHTKTLSKEEFLLHEALSEHESDDPNPSLPPILAIGQSTASRAPASRPSNVVSVNRVQRVYESSGSSGGRSILPKPSQSMPFAPEASHTRTLAPGASPFNEEEIDYPAYPPLQYLAQRQQGPFRPGAAPDVVLGQQRQAPTQPGTTHGLGHHEPPRPYIQEDPDMLPDPFTSSESEDLQPERRSQSATRGGQRASAGEAEQPTEQRTKHGKGKAPRGRPPKEGTSSGRVHKRGDGKKDDKKKRG